MRLVANKQKIIWEDKDQEVKEVKEDKGDKGDKDK